MSEVCSHLHHLMIGLPRLSFPFDVKLIPRNGIYMLFEKNEDAHGGDRIVRVGTHTGDGQLRSRLRQHFVKENKDRSIFRKNVGRALLNRDHDPFLQEWDRDLTTSAAKLLYDTAEYAARKAAVEAQVSEYMRGSFRFVVLPVEGKAKRLRLEARSVSTISWCQECSPSSSWLGLFSPLEKIRESGLWQVNELYKEPLSGDDLHEMERLVDSTRSEGSY